MDEKMKDSVKITVIATGFRQASGARPRQQESHTSFVMSHDDGMSFSQPAGFHEPQMESMPEEPMPEPVASVEIEETFAEPAPVVGMAHASERTAADVISLDSVRNAMVAQFEQNDLDVPAFLRKRGDVM
jgi:hypothetical protein